MLFCTTRSFIEDNVTSAALQMLMIIGNIYYVRQLPNLGRLHERHCAFNLNYLQWLFEQKSIVMADYRHTVVMCFPPGL